jgi:hypothetical protein
MVEDLGLVGAAVVMVVVVLVGAVEAMMVAGLAQVVSAN